LQSAGEVQAVHTSAVLMTHLLPLHWPEQQSLVETHAPLPQAQLPEMQRLDAQSEAPWQVAPTAPGWHRPL
jgi:hypothetical protein